jgi:hypothetical protein
MCTNPSKQEFGILYEDLVEIDDVIRAWLKVKPKKNKHCHMILVVIIMAI